MKNIDETLSRIQNHFGAKTRKEMMKKWGIPYNTLSTWVARDSIPAKRLMELSEKENLSLDWLRTGEGEKINIPEPSFLTGIVSEGLHKYGGKNQYTFDQKTEAICKIINIIDEDKRDQAISEIMDVVIKYIK